MTDNTPVRYGGWAKDREGWFLGLSGWAWLIILATGAPLLLAVGAHRWLAALGWLPVWAVVIVLVAVPVRGRPAFRWTTDSLLHFIGRRLGWSAWQSVAATGSVDDLDQADLPGVLSGVRIHDGPPFGAGMRRPVLVADARERTWAAVARISHPGVGQAETPTRARMGAGLAELLEAAASVELVSVVALQVRTIPDDGAEREAWQRDHLHADAPPLAQAITNEVSVIIGKAGVRHEAFLTVVVPEERITKPAHEAGRGIDGRGRVLHGVMREVEARLLGPIGCTEVAWLDSPPLAGVLRTGFAPGDRAAHTAASLAARTNPNLAGLPMAAAGPTTAPPPERRHYHHDAWTTATCTVLLPDKGAVMGALAPVLTPTQAGERRCSTVFFESLGRHRADRLIGRDAMSSDLATELRRKSGFQIRAAHRRDAARVTGQDERLADGNALVRVAMAAAVTVPDTWSITDHARRLEADITTSGFTPLRLDLAQDSGFAAACIPLGIGLPRKRSLP